MRVDQLERRPLRLDRERTDAAVGGTAAEVGEEEVVAVTLGQADARIRDESRRPVGEIGDGGNDVRRLDLRRLFIGPIGIPHPLAVPGTAVGKVLEVHPPADVGSLDDVDPAGAVAAVGVVLPREEASIVVERQLLRIAKAVGEDLQLRSVRLAAEDGPGVGHGEPRPLLRFDVEPAVADAEVEAAVRSHDQAVHVVSAESDAHAVAGVQRRPLVGLAVAVGVAELPEVGDAGVEDVAAAGEDAGAGAALDAVEPVGEDGRLLEPAVAVAVLEKPQAVVLPRVFRDLVAEVLAEIGEPVGDGLSGQIVEQPVPVIAVVFDAVLLAERLTDEDPPALVEAEADGIGDQRL